MLPFDAAHVIPAEAIVEAYPPQILAVASTVQAKRCPTITDLPLPSDNENYETTVIEEIINHLEEDQYQPISPLNQRIIEEIKLGIQQNELRSSDFFKTFMDEEVVTKTADALINAHETSNWEKHNIYFSKEEELVDKIVKDVIIRHKREFVVKIINDLKHQISEENSAETYLKIINLTKLKNKIDENLFRIL
jgi:DNA primase